MPKHTAGTDTANSTALFLDAIWDGQEGLAGIPTKSEQGGFADNWFEWPAQREELLAHVESMCESHDVYFVAQLQGARARAKDKGARPQGGRFARCDLDDGDITADQVRRWRPIIVESGTPGRLHVWVRLDRLADPSELERANRALTDELGGDRAPTHGTGLMRLPGTFNHKTKQPRAVVLQSIPVDPPGVPATSFRAAGDVTESPTQADSERTFTRLEALDFCRPALAALAKAANGERNLLLNAATKQLSHFVPAFWSEDEVREIVTSAAAECGYPARGEEAEVRATIASALTSRHGDWIASVADGAPPGLLPNLPDEFWAARPVLSHIRQAAHARAQSADLVLCALLARLSAMVPHDLKFATVLGDEGSLNLFVAPVGDSGTGKSTGAANARSLLDVPTYLDDRTFFDGLPLGSGEGVAEAFMGMAPIDTGETTKDGEPKTKLIRGQARHNAFPVLDEGEALAKMMERSGATIGNVLRSAWVGAELGQGNGRSETTRVIPAGSYSMGLLIGFQRHTALALLADVDAGTPQRFLWCAATDPSVPDDPGNHPGKLGNLLEDDYHQPRFRGPITFPEEVNHTLYAQKVARVRGDGNGADTMNSHESLMRCKLAALLALLDGRAKVDSRDWALAAQMWETSCAVRDSLVRYGQERASREARARDDAYVNREVRKAAAVGQVGTQLDRVAAVLQRAVEKEPKGRLTHGRARHALESRDRDLYEQAVELGGARKLFTSDAKALYPAESTR